MHTNEPDEHQTVCPRCGAEAEWSFLDPERRQIEVLCSDCGHYRMAREVFDRAAGENATLDEPEPGE